MLRFLLFTSSLFVTSLSWATVLVVDPFGEVGTYPDFPTAYAQAVNGDTIEVRPFTPDIINIFVDQDLTIIGGGHSLGQNYSDVYPLGYSGWKIRQLRVRNGAKLNLQSVLVEQDISLDPDCTLKLTKARCRNIFTGDRSNVELDRSTVVRFHAMSGTCGSACRSSAVRVYANNSFVGGLYAENNFYQANFVNCIVGQFYIEAKYGNLINCIVLQSGSIGFQNACSASMRTVKYSVVPSTPGYNSCDTTNTPGSQVISNVYSNLCSNACDSSFYLVPNSPAIGAGYNGEDCGIFGGPTPYELSGLPSRPWIYEFMAPPASAGGAGPMPVEIKVKAVD